MFFIDAPVDLDLGPIGSGPWIEADTDYEKLDKDSELGLEDRLSKIIQQDALQRKMNKIFQFQKNFLNGVWIGLSYSIIREDRIGPITGPVARTPLLYNSCIFQ